MWLKTYGVTGLMDWTTQLKVGKGCVSVHFTGGALTAYGVTPAKYQTKNEFFQRVIEGSDDFKRGRIKLLGVTEVADDGKVKKVVKKVVKKAAAVVPAVESAAEATGDAAAADCVMEDGVQAVAVADRYEAVQYLKEHFDGGLTMTMLRTKEAFEEAQKRFGVRFVFPQ